MVAAVAGRTRALYFGVRSTIKAWRAHLRITSTHVVVAGPLATRRVGLDDADRFVASLLDVGNGQPTIQLVRRSADPISIFVFVRAGWVWNLEKDVAKLERLPVIPRLPLASLHGNARRARTQPSRSV